MRACEARRAAEHQGCTADPSQYTLARQATGAYRKPIRTPCHRARLIERIVAADPAPGASDAACMGIARAPGSAAPAASVAQSAARIDRGQIEHPATVRP